MQKPAVRKTSAADKRSQPSAWDAAAETRRKRWTFLTNHATVLLHIARRPDDTMSLIAEELGLTERTTAYVIADLRAAGYIDVRKVGRHNRYKVRTGKPLRRSAHSRLHVKDLLEALGALS